MNNKATGKCQEELIIAKSENRQLLSYLATARRVIMDLLKPCSTCGERMGILNWNTKFYMLVCDNEKCPKYRQPGPGLLKEDFDSLGLSEDIALIMQ